MMRKNRTYIYLLIMIAVAAGLRFLYLLGDAPVADISRSGVFYVDEGTYVHNVVNKILYGQWFLKDDYNAISNVPVYTVGQFLLLKLFGLSMQSLRSTGIIYTILSLLCLWYLLKRDDLTLSFTAVTLMSLNFFFIIFNRIALVENMLILVLVVITLLLYQYYRKNTVWWLLAAVFLFWTGYFVKPTILFFLPLLILTIFMRPVDKIVKIRHLFIYALFSSLFLALAYLIWVNPHIVDWNYFEGRNIHQYIDESFLIFLTNYARYFSNLKLFQFMPVIYILFLFYLTFLLYEFMQKKRLSFNEWFFACWALCAFLFLGFFKYSPPRHSLILIPTIFVLTASFIVRLYRRELDFADKNLVFLFFPVAILSLCQILFGYYRIIVYSQNYISCYLPLISVIIIPALFIMARNKHLQRRFAFAFVGIAIILNLGQIFKYFKDIEFSYYHAMQDMKMTLQVNEEKDCVLLGDIAPLVSVELRTKAVNIIFRDESEPDRILHNRPNFLVLQEKEELQRLSDKMPFYFSDVELVKRYRIFDNYRNDDYTYLYAINNSHYLTSRKMKMVKN